MTRVPGTLTALVSLVVLLAPAAVRAQSGEASARLARAGVSPSRAGLGEAVTYRGRIPVASGVVWQWVEPKDSDDLSWSAVVPSRVNGLDGAPDTMVIRATVQAFRLGTVVIPGLEMRRRGDGAPPTLHLPTVRLEVTAMAGASDSSADLRPARGPFAAPWWERVPWRWVLLALALVALAVWLVRRFRRRRVEAPEPVPAFDPVAAALAQLAALRDLDLPGRGRFAEHAFHLSHIARRYLEATIGVVRPGHSTPELVARLDGTPLAHDDVAAIGGLLRVWDRLKFARAAATADEARRAEDAVESLVRRSAPPPPPPATKKQEVA